LPQAAHLVGQSSTEARHIGQRRRGQVVPNARPKISQRLRVRRQGDRTTTIVGAIFGHQQIA
jgi:hypothetical protein